MLGKVLQECPAELEADLEEYYHVNLQLIGTRGLSLSHVATLTAQLPMDSRVMAKLQGAAVRVDVRDVMLRDAINEIRGTNYNIIATHSKKKPSTPKPYQIPGMRKKNGSGDQLMRMTPEQLERRLHSGH